MSIYLTRQLKEIEDLEKALGSHIQPFESNLLNAWRKALTSIDDALSHKTVLEQDTIDTLVYEVVKAYRVLELHRSLADQTPAPTTVKMQDLVFGLLSSAAEDAVKLGNFDDDISPEFQETIEKTYG